MQYTSETEQLKLRFHELVEKVRENQAVLERFQKFQLAMLSAEDISVLLETLMSKSIRHFDISDCRLVWFDSQQVLRPLIDEETLARYGHRLVFSGLTYDIETLFENRELTPILKPLSPVDKLRWFPGKTQVASAAFIPLIQKGLLVGAYLLGSPELKRFTPDKATDFIAHMGLIASMCLQSNVNQEQIRMLSMLDNLTKVKNRRCFDNDIRKEIARSRRNNQPLSCLFIDADYFKKVNDTYGHQAGDETLMCLAKWVQDQLREGDHLARYGGEEFAVLLPQCNEGLALQVAERIRGFIEAQTINFESIEFQITLSIGSSTFNPKGYDALSVDDVIKSLLGSADLGVYDAKERGRNQVCVRPFSTNLEDQAVL